MASITVYFKPIVIAGETLPYYHQFIIYQPDSGQAQYLRGGPASNQGATLDSGGGSGSSGSGSGSGPNIPFGAVYIQSGNFINSTNTPDYFNPDGSTYASDLKQTIATGSDAALGAQFANMANYMKTTYNADGTIGANGIAYGPTGPNSNSVVTTALQYAGLPLPTGTGLDGTYAAPGSDVNLSQATFGTPFANDLSGGFKFRSEHPRFDRIG